MARRRGNQEGSVYRRKDGRWVGSVSIDGKRYERYGNTVWEALEGLEEVKQESRKSSVTSLGDWIEQWLDHMSSDLRPSTLNTYTSTLEVIKRELGDQQLDEVTPLLLTETFSKLKKQGKGARPMGG